MPPLAELDENAAALLVEVGDLARKGSSRRSNSTAYRIFKLLQWLMEKPLSVDAMNQRFQGDEGIGRPVSNDSIWLYINTLKALGCSIRRPSPKNNFCYEMLSHPFGIHLEERQLEMLAQAKLVAQRHFSPQEMIALDGLLRKVVSHGDLGQSPELVNQLFAQTRSLDAQDAQQRVEQLEQAILQSDLLAVTYCSPLKGEEVFLFLPESLFYRQGVVYVRGERPEHTESSSLRVDRMLAFVPVQDESLKQVLLARQRVKTEVVLQIYVDSPQHFQGFSLDPDQGVYQESRLWVDASRPYYEVRLQVRDFFYLKQTLLMLGLPFAIMAPTEFRESVQGTLQKMLEYYQAEGVPNDGNG